MYNLDVEETEDCIVILRVLPVSIQQDVSCIVTFGELILSVSFTTRCVVHGHVWRINSDAFLPGLEIRLNRDLNRRF